MVKCATWPAHKSLFCPHPLLVFVHEFNVAHLILFLVYHFVLIGLSYVVIDTSQGVYLGLQWLEDAPFLLKEFADLLGNELFLLGGIHHDDLLIEGHLFQGEDPDPTQITILLLLYDGEFILHSIADAEHPLLLKDVDRLLQCVGADHLLRCADVDHLLQCGVVDHLLLCEGVDHHHLLDGEGHPHPCGEELLLCGIGHLHLCAGYHQGADQALPCNLPLPQLEDIIVGLHDAGLHLLCSINHLFSVRKDLQVPHLEGLLEMDGVLSLQYGVYLHLQLGEIPQGTKEVLWILL